MGRVLRRRSRPDSRAEGKRLLLLKAGVHRRLPSSFSCYAAAEFGGLRIIRTLAVADITQDRGSPRFEPEP
jgi:hypothetical protein